jgi:hypothetical protein
MAVQSYLPTSVETKMEAHAEQPICQIVGEQLSTGVLTNGDFKQLYRNNS